MTAPLNHAWVDATEAPLYVWRLPPEPTTEELEGALRAIRDWVSTLTEPYGWINDARTLRISTVATQRAMIADHLKYVEPYSARYCAGMATIVNSPIVRGIATTIGWLYKYPFPVYYAPHERDARAWVQHQLEHAYREPEPPARAEAGSDA